MVVTEALIPGSLSHLGFEELSRFSCPIQISEPSPPDPATGVVFVGRFATSNPEYMFHDAFEDLYSIRSNLVKARRLNGNSPMGTEEAG